MKIKREAILWYAIQYDGDWKKIGNAIKAHEDYSIISYPYTYFTIVDDMYPDAFKRLRYPPWIIFYQGEIDLLKRKGIGIVGARNCSLEALQNTDTIVQRLKSKYVIVSGLAKGADAAAHRTAILCGAKTIGVIASGLKIQYPSCNADLYKTMQKEHLILSEYPYDTGIQKHHFAWNSPKPSHTILLLSACLQHQVW